MSFHESPFHISLIPDAGCDYDLTDFVAPAEPDRDWFDLRLWTHSYDIFYINALPLYPVTNMTIACCIGLTQQKIATQGSCEATKL